ncbi:MAG: four helix bundle protein [Flavihumibacter sp.]|nr:four helix bundle protein [Flavihumibacter sp.]
MKNHNVVADKSFWFGLRIIKLFQYLRNHQVERILCIQLLRSGTSIGAKYRRSTGRLIKKGFYF